MIMPLMDEFKEEREALKQAPLNQKIKYYVYYYKWHALAVIAVLIIAFTWIRDVVTSKDAALYVALINAAALDDAEQFDMAYTAYAGIDPDEYDVIFDLEEELPDTGDEQRYILRIVEITYDDESETWAAHQIRNYGDIEVLGRWVK